MKPSVEQISNLLSQRDDLRPEEGYWQDFLREFHHNQRVEAANQPAVTVFLKNLGSFFSEVSPSRWAYGAGFAYAAAAVIFLIAPRGADTETMPSSQINHQIVPAPSLERMDQPDATVSEEVSEEQAF